MPKKVKPNAPDQPEFAPFSTFDSELVDECRKKLTTGTTAGKDGSKADRIVSDILSGVPWSVVMRAHKVGWHTISALVHAAESSGRVESLNNRLAATAGIVAEMAAERIADTLVTGAVPAPGLSVAMGVATDKRALLTGLATAPVTIHAQHVTVGPSLADERAQLLAMARGARPATASTALAPASQVLDIATVARPVLPAVPVAVPGDPAEAGNFDPPSQTEPAPRAGGGIDAQSRVRTDVGVDPHTQKP